VDKHPTSVGEVLKPLDGGVNPVTAAEKNGWGGDDVIVDN
jgi:hypothetical protein